MIKIATIEDFDLVFKLLKSFYSTLKQFDLVDEDKAKAMVTAFLNAPRNEKLVLLHGEVGLLAAFIEPFILGVTPIATEVAWWVEPSARKSSVGKELVDAFEFWAKKLNCKYTSMACFADYDVSKYYESIGYVLHEKAYIKEII